MDEVTTRVCCRCGEWKPETPIFFSFRKNRGTFNSFCKVCNAARSRKFRTENPEAALAIRQRYAEKHPEREKERHRAARAANPEHHREKVRKSYQEHSEKRRAARRAYRAAHLEEERARDRAWKYKYPERYARARIRRAQLGAEKRAEQYGVVIEAVDYFAVLDRDGMRCHICAQDITEGWLSFDHIIPLSKGGPHAFQNVAVAHYVCNRRKNTTVTV
ncbi:HNH endonuclease [Deinococcus sp. Arct2-2]|uniref:HNH endonuclease n=1 Tax=Deinococcus sp. Arct2-2 TaxID=2568653 RepID=UPI0010A3064C|nr:HNH endonuclease [Deinococcus sp. Arct2-2]THF70457.1 HNH endonuclease [Deinococcus sp. Arct2-2]